MQVYQEYQTPPKYVIACVMFAKLLLLIHHLYAELLGVVVEPDLVVTSSPVLLSRALEEIG